LQSVWGSYWKGSSWGYACCHSFVKQSYCTGEAGKEIQANKLTMPKMSKKGENAYKRFFRRDLCFVQDFS